MSYNEPISASSPQRKRLADEVNSLIEIARESANENRKKFFSPDTSSVTAYEASLAKYRAKLLDMLGWPLTELSSQTPDASVDQIGEDEFGRIYRVHIPTIGSVHAYGLLFLPHHTGPHPLVITQHGGQGAPEVASGITPDGTFNYNNLIRGLRSKSVAIFAPQLLVWHESLEPKINQYQIDRDLRQIGGSRAALDLSMLKKSLDWLVTHPEINPERIGMAGLSYGGFYTLFFTALEPRIRVAVSSCFMSDRYTYNWEDWVWSGSANFFLDREVARLICPRPLFIEVGEKDEVFDVSKFKATNGTFDIAQAYEKLGISEKFQSRIHPGGHEYDTDGEAERFLMKWL